MEAGESGGIEAAKYNVLVKKKEQIVVADKSLWTERSCMLERGYEVKSLNFYLSPSALDQSI